MQATGVITDLGIDYKTRNAKISLVLDTKDLGVVEQLKNENKLDINLEKHRERRGLDANAYFHVLVNKLARVHNISDEDMKIEMNLSYGTIDRFEDGSIKGCKVPKQTNMREIYEYSKWYRDDDEGNSCYLFYKRTHLLNTKEMAQLINGVIQECHDVGIETRPKEEIDSLLRSWNK